MKGRAFALSAVVLITLAVACSDRAPAKPCSDIPAGGCPISRGVACEDPSCRAVYACLPDNVWELREECPARDAGGATDAFVPTAPTPSFDASVDAPPGAFGGPGCGVLLEPDCPLGVALACNGMCCGCEDLFVCENGGWTYWGSCGQSGPRPLP